MLVGIDAGLVPVAPVDADGVVAHWLHASIFSAGLNIWNGIRGRPSARLARRRAVRARASRAGALVAQVLETVLAAVAIFPIDFDAFGLGNGDVFRVG